MRRSVVLIGIGSLVLSLVVGSASVAAAGSSKWIATVSGAGLNGAATLTAQANGTASLTVAMSGLRARTVWSADVDAGPCPDRDGPLGERASNEVIYRWWFTPTTTATQSVGLSSSLFALFRRDAAAHGVSITVRNGSRSVCTRFATK